MEGVHATPNSADIIEITEILISLEGREKVKLL